MIKKKIYKALLGKEWEERLQFQKLMFNSNVDLSTIEQMSILLGVGISLLTGLLLWINIQILIVSRSILNETITEPESSFSNEFLKARKNNQNSFEWNGKIYSTDIAQQSIKSAQFEVLIPFRSHLAHTSISARFIIMNLY